MADLDDRTIAVLAGRPGQICEGVREAAKVGKSFSQRSNRRLRKSALGLGCATNSEIEFASGKFDSTSINLKNKSAGDGCLDKTKEKTILRSCAHVFTQPGSIATEGDPAAKLAMSAMHAESGSRSDQSFSGLAISYRGLMALPETLFKFRNRSLELCATTRLLVPTNVTCIQPRV